MTRAICVCFHKYQPYGSEFYEPILSFFLQNMKKYKDEYDRLYLIDSNWNIDLGKYYDKAVEGKFPLTTVLKVNPSLRYYDAYKEILPQIKEDLVLFMDNDMVVYKKGIIDTTFKKLDEYGVCSIYDTIGQRTDLRLNNKSKWCLYWFATQTALLRQYTGCEWGPVLWGETLSELTFKMLNDGITSYEWPEDKSSIYFGGGYGYDEGTGNGKNLGYYHIRAGSVPALLLAYKQNDPDKYWDYLKTQPKREYLRQLAWYHHMELETLQEPTHTWSIIRDLKISQANWTNYMNKFKEFHGL